MEQIRSWHRGGNLCAQPNRSQCLRLTFEIALWGTTVLGLSETAPRLHPPIELYSVHPNVGFILRHLNEQCTQGNRNCCGRRLESSHRSIHTLWLNEHLKRGTPKASTDPAATFS